MSGADAAGAIRKVTLRLIVPLGALLLLNSIDRVNISFAALHMNAELGLTPQTYGLAVSLFFVGYIAIQIPSLMLLRRFGMRRWLFTIALTWGVAATSCAFVTRPATLNMVRVVLGIAEGGFAPGLVYYLTLWMPQRYRARALSLIMIGVPVSVMIGGPLSGWLMSIDNPLSLAGWRWMLLIEGVPTIVLAALVLWLFADTPRSANWLGDQERAWIESELTGERRAAPQAVALGSLLASGRFWGAAACWFALMSGAYGLIYWLPQVVKQFPGVTDLQAGVLSALPWVASIFGMLLNSRHSDRTGERYWHVGLGTVACGLFLALALVPHSGLVALLLITLAGFSFGAGQSPFWTIPPALLSAGVAATGIALINMLGNSSGIVGPLIIGWLRQRTGSFNSPVLFMAAVLLVGGVALIATRPREQPAGRHRKPLPAPTAGA